MKNLLLFILSFCLLLCGCSAQESEMDQALLIRKHMLESKGCAFDTLITADYGNKVYQFKMQCTADVSGNLSFTVYEPESIKGISGKIQEEKGALIFDDRVLAFELLADGQVTPVTAPWLLIRTLRGGYIRACSACDEGICMTIYDSYEEDALQLQIWTDKQLLPVRAEILFRGRRVLTIEVANFVYL